MLNPYYADICQVSYAGEETSEKTTALFILMWNEETSTEVFTYVRDGTMYSYIEELDYNKKEFEKLYTIIKRVSVYGSTDDVNITIHGETMRIQYLNDEGLPDLYLLYRCNKLDGQPQHVNFKNDEELFEDYERIDELIELHSEKIRELQASRIHINKFIAICENSDENVKDV